MPRTSEHAIEPLFLQRWSPRAYDASAMPATDLMTILEAARWAPSAFNVQPWRFLYAHRSDAHWQKFLKLLDPFNAAWAQRASALVILISDRAMPGGGEQPGKPSRTHSFDAGAAWAHLALQATALGYQAHGMAGINIGKIETELGVPASFRVEIGVAIGRQADPSVLPEKLQAREQPSQRRPLGELAFAGSFLD